jgi:magnesium transporter
MARPQHEHHLDEPALKHARSDFVRVFAGQTVGEALATVQGSEVGGRIVYFYVVDEQGRLRGVVPTRRLLLSPPDTPIDRIMVEKVIALPHTATLLEACEFFMFHRLLALPIVDDEGRILGVIDVELYTDEISDLAHREESDDVFQLIGVRLAQVQRASMPVVFSRRFPWLLCNIVGGLAAAVLAGFYQDILDRIVLLALFIPVVLALAESVSIQSLTLTLQAQHGRQFDLHAAMRDFVREMPVGLALGIASGTLVAAAAWIWRGEGWAALSILLSISLAVMTAALFGLTVPTVLRAAQRDPKIAAGPITLALTDLVTLFFYLALATWLLG